MKKLVFAVFVCAFSLLMLSCKKSEPFYEATATIKTSATDNTCYFQIDDATAMVSSNDAYKTNPFKKELRVHMLYYDRGDAAKPGWSKASRWFSGEIIKLDTILTKKPIIAGEYKSAPIELVNTWVNSIEDGYMTLCFECWWGVPNTVHYINLARTQDPYTFQLLHDDNGDSKVYRNTGLVAFDIHDLPIQTGKEFDVFLKYEGYVSAKTVAFHYKDGKFYPPTRVDTNGYLE